MRAMLMTLAMVAAGWSADGSAQTFVKDEEELKATKAAISAILEGDTVRGWSTREVLYKALGDNAFGDPGYHIYLFTKSEEEALKEVQGTYACYRQDKTNFTAGSFDFGRNDNGSRYSYVNREVQLPKRMSGELRNVVSVGQVVAFILAVYYENPAIYEKGSKAWEDSLKDVQRNTDFSKGLDMSPTVIEGRERWSAQGRISLTVQRYYNCGATVRYKLQ